MLEKHTFHKGDYIFSHDSTFTLQFISVFVSFLFFSEGYELAVSRHMYVNKAKQ